LAVRAETTHVLLDRALILYRRPRSTVWQCRYKVGGVWQRATTQQHDLAQAQIAARELMIEAEIRKRSNLPVITSKFRHVARLAIERLEQEARIGRGKITYKQYIQIIRDYLIPILGSRSITNIGLLPVPWTPT
jgi:hypothetical protein